MERDNARKVYTWLWWSPLLTVPTLFILVSNEIGNEMVCSGRQYFDCDWDTAERVTLVIAVLGSALWHLFLLGSARSKESAFIRWHGRQALVLAGVRTVVPLAFVLTFGFWYETLLFIPILLVIWFFGTLWGQNQAQRGDCSLARWFGHGDVLPEPEATVAALPKSSQLVDEDVKSLIETIRFSRNQEERDKALMKLKELGMVEEL